MADIERQQQQKIACIAELMKAIEQGYKDSMHCSTIEVNASISIKHGGICSLKVNSGKSISNISDLVDRSKAL